jgi:diadenosine tetraphosphate (Ap4A) HIT family hydrolase
MPETPEELYARAAGALRVPKVIEWDTWPFQGDVVLRELRAPTDEDPPRGGAGGVDCSSCSKPDAEYVWTNERWRLAPLPPNGLPLIMLLTPRQHYAEPGDLPDDLAADFGVLAGRIERAVRSLEGVGRVHISRFGDGGEHLHWFFIARPARFPQLLGSNALIWDDVLPVTPEDVWKANTAHVLQGLA